MTPRPTSKLPPVRRVAYSAAPGLVFALLLPKCPLCVAALLTTLGVGSALASELAPYAYGLALIALLAPLALYALIMIVRAQRAKTACHRCDPATSQTPLSLRTSRLDSRPGQPQTSAS